MSAVLSSDAGGYRYLKGVFQYSAGVAALDGFEIERARFRALMPLEEGFKAIEAHLKRIGRPAQAFCACELRSPEPFLEAGFAAFNRSYVGQLERWGIFRDGENPVARTNVCPEVDAPKAPSIYAFSYTVPVAAHAPPSFVGAGSGEAPEGAESYNAVVIRPGDQSPDGLLEKARWVLAEMERRMGAFGLNWSHMTATGLYTVYDVHPFLASEIAGRGAMRHALSWYFARPPVRGLDFEMDVRAVVREIVL
jgi:hypothetical protein